MMIIPSRVEADHIMFLLRTEKDAGCKCRTCLRSEDAERDFELPYRHAPGRAQGAFHLLLHLALPLAGVILIGRSWWALSAVFGALAAYLFNSFFLCATCPYHHAGAVICGCYPKSIFSFKRYRWHPWGVRENLIGRSTVIILTVGPAAGVLAARGDTLAISVLLLAVTVVLSLTSMVSCPRCRQRSVCTLGRLTLAGISRTNIRT
jgi:hypothetical protein